MDRKLNGNGQGIEGNNAKAQKKLRAGTKTMRIKDGIILINADILTDAESRTELQAGIDFKGQNTREKKQRFKAIQEN